MSTPLTPEEMSALLPDCIATLNGEVVVFRPDPPQLTMAFKAVRAFCHSEVIVQGGFITGMIDACMAHVCFAMQREHGLIAIPTLEIKVSFISPGHPGRLIATAWPKHMGKSTAFLEGELHQEEEGGNRLVATATSTVKLIYDRSKR